MFYVANGSSPQFKEVIMKDTEQLTSKELHRDITECEKCVSLLEFNSSQLRK